MEEIEATGAHKTLGAFLRAVRDFAELESRIGCPVPPPFPEPASSAASGGHPAERQARSVRTALGLGSEPIASMRRLLSERLAVPLFFVSPGDEEGELDPAMHGASTQTPRRAILVNLTPSWWHTRMTLAHEFAHLLFDQAREVLFSPPRRIFKKPGRSWSWRLFDGFDDIEVQADAFAACFLAPADGVKRCVGAREPSSEGAIGAVGRTFGVGRTVAINRLQHVFNLSQAIRAEMENRTACHYEADFPEDQEAAPSGLRSGVLVPLVMEALTAGKIGKARAWEYLGLPLTEPARMLPAEFRQPPVGRETRLAAAAQRYLAASYPERPLHALRVRCEGGQGRVSLGEGGIGERELTDAGSLSLDEDGHVLSAHVRAASQPT